jgi:hypothetical protein
MSLLALPLRGMLLFLGCCMPLHAASGPDIQPAPGTYASLPAVQVTGMAEGQVARFTVNGKEPQTLSSLVPPEGLLLAHGRHYVQVRVFAGGRPVGPLLGGWYQVGFQAVSTANEQTQTTTDGERRSLGKTVQVLRPEQMVSMPGVDENGEDEEPAIELQK